MLGFIAPWRVAASRAGSTTSSRTCAGSNAPRVEAAVQELGHPGDPRRAVLPPRLAIARRLMEHWVQR